MPFLDLGSDQRLYYEIDDWADPWTHPPAVLLVHGFTENVTAWYGWVPDVARR